MNPFFVYLLRCGDGSYYCGHTDNMDVRMQQHDDGLDGYTATRKPVELVWRGEFETREGAIGFEQQIKGWSRAKKEALIRGDWHAIQVHAWGTRNPLPDHLSRSAEASIPQPERVSGAPTPQPERVSGASTPQPERVGGASIPQPERVGGTSIPQPERVGGASIPQPEREGGASIPQLERVGRASIPQPERVGGASIPQPEREGVIGAGASVCSVSANPHPVRPEVSKGSFVGNADLLALMLGESSAPQRRAIAKAITLLESTRADHRAQADELLNALLPHTCNSFRLGISGVPGVGKSTFIEVLGLHLIAQGHRVAVLTIDPSSTVSGGSILGDKTRMEKLSVHERAYIRPSPSSGTLGGVASMTREAMLVCEAAGYDVVIVETVGVGQSEIAVAGMTDMFVLMQLPNAGDDLQAIKKGVMELADLVVINKADIDPGAAMRAQGQIVSSLRLLGMHRGGHEAAWQPQVIQLSALKADGVDRFWAAATQFRATQTASGQLSERRKNQALAWMWERIEAGLKHAFNHHPRVQALLPYISEQVINGALTPSVAARNLLLNQVNTAQAAAK
jgi:LAO/AO transport system kinase